MDTGWGFVDMHIINKTNRRSIVHGGNSIVYSKLVPLPTIYESDNAHAMHNKSTCVLPAIVVVSAVVERSVL
jgi:TATA-binding protein-associated factor Taf7